MTTRSIWTFESSGGVRERVDAKEELLPTTDTHAHSHTRQSLHTDTHILSLLFLIDRNLRLFPHPREGR